MADAITIKALQDASLDAKSLEEVVNGNEGKQVTTRKGETYPSVKKAINTMFQNGGLPATPFKTKALMTASALANDKYAMVTDDTVNNGLYIKTAGAWIKSSYDPLTQAKEYTDTAKTDAIAASKVYVDEKNKSNIKTKVGKNLLDKNALISGYSLTTSGVPTVSADNHLSDFIESDPSAAYSFTSVNSVCFYDSNKLFLSRTGAPTSNLTTPANTKFMRAVVFRTQIDKAQIEKGSVSTIYSPFILSIDGELVDAESIKSNAVVNRNIKDFTINANKLDDVVWLNMHDATKLVKGFMLLDPSGSVVVSAGNDITEYIPCRPSTVHTSPRFTRVAFYDINKVFISLSADNTFTTPSDCRYIRFSLSAQVSNSFQVNEGSTVPTTVPQPHKYSLSNMTTPKPTYKELAATRGRLYSFTDAWVAWKNKEKFPIAFMGDSTTEGTGTSGGSSRPTGQGLGYDYIRPNSYSAVFQALIREATGNTIMRAYNAGFLGTTANYGLDNFDEMFGSAYSDVKMIGISFGINDRNANSNTFKILFLPKMEALIQKCLDRGIQPFLLTTQPVTIPFWTLSGGGTDIEEVANNYKRDLANKYNLEIIDVNKYGELFMQYSDKPLLNTIMENNSNVIHFGDGGHKFTAELIFSHFCKRVIWTYNDGERLDYSTQKMDSRLMHTELVQFSTPNNGFKLGVNKTQETATDLLYQDFYVFNVGRKQLDLTAYYANAAVGQYVLVNGVQTTITTQGQALGTLDLGLHKIKAYSSATTTLDWLGFKLQ